MNKRDRVIKKVRNYLALNDGRISWTKAIILRARLKKVGFIWPIHQSITEYLNGGGKIVKLPYFKHETEFDVNEKDCRYFANF